MINERVIELVQVEMLVHTFYGKPLKPGDIIEVEQTVAERWERNRIAKIIASNTGQTGGSDEGGNANLTVAALREIAEANGVDLSGLKKKDDIIEALRAAGVEV